jgi:hypothetical protein
VKPVHFVCVCLMLAGTFVLAQFGSAPLTNQPNGISNAQELQSGVPANPSRIRQGATFARRGSSALKATAFPRAEAQASGLNFEFFGEYGVSGPYINAVTWVVVADVNGDGKPDLLMTAINNLLSPFGIVAVLLGNGDGTFQTAVNYASGASSATSVAVGDVNGDGKADLLVAGCVSINSNCTGEVGVLLGNGDGTFQTAVTYDSGGYNATSVAVADLNGDGKPDLVVANACVSISNCANGTIGVLLNNGDGTFQTAVTYGSGGYEGPFSNIQVAVTDVNDDGRPDLLVSNGCVSSNSCANGAVGVLLGNGDGTFQTAVTYGSGGGSANSVAVADVNEDGKPDLLVANRGSGTVGVLLGNGDGTFQTAVTYGTGGSAVSVAAADVNGDGNPDLLIAGQEGLYASVNVLLGNGDGTFQTAVTLYPGSYNSAVSVAAEDVNGDGKPDVLAAIYDGTFGGFSEGALDVLINTSLTPTITGLTSSQNPSKFGQAVTFTAAVTPQKGFDKATPTGTASFIDGTTNIGTSNLNSSGVAALTISTLAEGTHSITAAYSGDTNFVPSTSSALDQVEQGAVVAVSPTSLNFGNEAVGVTSAPQSVTFMNAGNIALAIASIVVTGANNSDFAQTNNCPRSLAPNGSCNIKTTFTPTATGIRNASVSITDSAPGSPQVIALRGNVEDFSLAASPPTLTVTPGQVGNYTVTVSPLNGFNRSVALSCSAVPPVSTCTLTPNTVTLDGSSPATVQVAVVTTAASIGLAQPVPDPPQGNAFAKLLAVTGTLSFTLLVVLSDDRARRPRLLDVLVFSCLISLGMTLSACGGGGSPGSSGGATPPGTYNVTVAGTFTSGSANLVHSTKLTLVVQ